jgi:histidine ammonia-lyase
MNRTGNKAVNLTGNDLTIEQVISAARYGAEVTIDEKVFAECRKSEELIADKAAKGKVVYGVTTGFGANVDKVIKSNETIEIKQADGSMRSVNKLRQLQINLLRSHSTGIGENFSEEIVRAIMLIRLNTLLQGYSGVQKKTITTLCDFINKRIHPVIPQQGSVGSSGDLCPLSHMALALIGEGWIVYKGETMRTEDFFIKYASSLKVEKAELSYKEGLALTNGTSVMAAAGVFAIAEAEEVLNVSLVNSSLFFETLCAREDFYGYEPIHTIRRHRGQLDIAKAIGKIMKGSTYVNLFVKEFSNLDDKTDVDKISSEIIKVRDLKDDKEETLKKFLKKKSKSQDAYSVRCIPQVFGASLHAIRHVRSVLTDELNAAVDNPLIFVNDDRVISGGNFHGQPIALVMDYLKVAVAEIGNIVERQVNKLVDESNNDCLPPFLTKNGGLNSGLMIPQYAAASVVSENKVLVHPASADSIPTCANTEDHVSMGTIAARQALQIVRNVKSIVSIAMLTSHHGFMLRKEQLEKFGVKDLVQSSRTKALYEKIKTVLPHWDDNTSLNMDRFLYDDLQALNKHWQELVETAGSNFDLQ